MATIDELARKNAIAQIPTDGSKAPAYDGSSSTELGRNVSNSINALAGVAPVMTGANALLNASRLGSLAQASPAAINAMTPSAAAQPSPIVKPVNPTITPGVSPTGGITGLTAPPANTTTIADIAKQPTPVAKTTGAIQKIARAPLNVPLQQNAGVAQSAAVPATVGQPELPESPIAYVGYGGNNSTQVAYKDGRTMEIAQGQAMPDDVQAFNLISQQAGQQGGNVNVMRGVPETYNKDGSLHSAGGVQQTLALPAKPGEAFMREVPVELGGNIAAIGKYQAAQSQGAINNADTTTAANAQRMAELGLTTASAQQVANIHKDASLGSAGISAGASKYNADKSSETQLGIESSRADATKKNLVMNPEQVGTDAMGSPIIKDVPYIRNPDGTMRKAIQAPAITEAQAHKEANAAIANKADKKAVNARLVEAGFQPLK